MEPVLAHYRYLHTIPEVGFTEIKTSAYLADHLEAAGYTVQRHIGGKTGVTGLLDSGVPGPVLALRADMDALGHIIDGRKCARHACGHDGHSSMVLTAAEEAVQKGLVKKGKLKILFQPAEELGTGALSMIEGGAIDDVDILIGAHVQTSANVPTGTFTPAMYHAAQYMLETTFTGKAAHGSRPHLGVNALETAALAICAAAMVRLDPNLSYSVKPTRCLCDSGALNAIPAEAVVSWDLRAETNSAMDELVRKVLLAAEHAAASAGAVMTHRKIAGVPAAEYTEKAIALIKEAIVDVLGEKGLYHPIPLTGGEDFHYYIQHKPSLEAGYFGIGCDATPGLHDPNMHFDTSFLIPGKDVFVDIIQKVLS